MPVALHGASSRTASAGASGVQTSASAATTSAARCVRARLSRSRARRLSEMSIAVVDQRSEEHTSELQSLMRISYAVFCLKKKSIKDKQRPVHARNITRHTIQY